ncbi:MAG: SRPBCC family protein [Armatimonadetes bacterium]|nr:SRPBCC family protein [Armatimonadota bacterium]
MPSVDVSILINAPVETVYAIAKDSRSFPDFMKDVQSVTPIEEDGNRFVAEWVGLIPQFMLKVRWTQEDLWNDAEHSCHFRQLKGDYDKLEGTWHFTAQDGGTMFVTHLDYEYNVPTLGALVKKVIHTIVVKNLDGINQAIKNRAESQVAASR